MAKSNPFSKAFHSLLPFRDFLYLLQLEEYYIIESLRTFLRFFWRRNLERRDHLKWTLRAKLTACVSVIIFLFFETSLFLAIAYYRSVWILIILMVLSFILIPAWVWLSNLFLIPLFIYGRRRICHKAHAHLQKLAPYTQVIAVAGSYGKTTTKNFLDQLLHSSYRIQITPGNVNTAAGIANWLLKDLQSSSQILIIEMDAYKPGEIKQSCDMVNPDVSLITMIGDQHLEKFGSQKRLARSLLETFEYTKRDGVCLLSNENRAVIKKLNIDLDPITQGKMVMDIPRAESINTSLTSDSAKQDLAFAVAVARLFKIPDHFIEDTCQHLELPDRRQKSSTLFGYELIDDSYNISFSTALAGLARAKQEADRRKKKLLVMTAGIAEMNKKDSREKNRIFGQELAKQTDKVVLLKSIYYPFVLSGIQEQKKDAILSLTFQEAWSIIRKKFSPEEYFILMQPELTDLSY